MTYRWFGARAIGLLTALGLPAGMLVMSAGAAAAATCPTVDPVTHQVSPTPVANSSWYGCDLHDADLTGADLSGDDLTATNFVGAKLTDDDQSGVTCIYTANFSNATMTGIRSGGIPPDMAFLPTGWSLMNGYFVGPGANLSGAALHANLSTVDMSGADFSGANISGTGFGTVTGANFTGANMTGTVFYQADLNNSDLTGADLTRASFVGATMTGVSLSGTTLTGVLSYGITGTPLSIPAPWALRAGSLIGPQAALPGVSLGGADLAGTDLAGANLEGTHLASADLTGTDLTGADLTNADATSANLTNANLTGATLTGTTLTGAIWSGTTCPDGTSSDLYVDGCLSMRLYGVSGFIAPKAKSTLAKSAKKTTVKFRLTGPAGNPIAIKTAAALAKAHKVRAALSGPGIPASTAACTWAAAHHYFQCTVKIPAAVRTGKTSPYSITAQEKLGTSFARAPANGTTANPETVYFK